MSNNPYNNVNTYSKNQKAQAVPTGNSRDTDSRALLACARRLDEAKQMMEKDAKSKESSRFYSEAIRQNQRLWTIFQIALSDPQNPLPQNLKITLLNLSRYIDKTSFSAIGKYRPDLLDSLVSINRIIAAGLSKQTAGAETAAPLANTQEVPTALMTSA